MDTGEKRGWSARRSASGAGTRGVVPGTRSIPLSLLLPPLLLGIQFQPAAICPSRNRSATECNWSRSPKKVTVFRKPSSRPVPVPAPGTPLPCSLDFHKRNTPGHARLIEYDSCIPSVATCVSYETCFDFLSFRSDRHDLFTARGARALGQAVKRNRRVEF